jgi:L-2,3-diaminopropanoate---citrate ligase
VDKNAMTYTIYFPKSKTTISGELLYYSEIGEHDYKNIKLESRTDLEYRKLVNLIINELKHDYPTVTEDHCINFFKKVENSCKRLELFIKNSKPLINWDYLSSEQSLLYGHPFHPFPKNTEGFSDIDVNKYCPELRTSFQLCYMAVRKDLFLEEWVSKERKINLHSSVREHVQRKFKDKGNSYEILPMHPWQYKYVQTINEVRNYIDQGKIIPLGSAGPKAYPTSSVRTVYIPEMNCNIKLSLNIQITNMIRNNSKEQMRRTLDATKYLIQKNCFQNDLNTSISYEVGVCTCHFENEDVTKLFTVVYRPIEFDVSSTYVLSSLVETPFDRNYSRLYSMINHKNIDQWFRRYLEISLIPMVRLADEQGIHFEAHLQNSLLTIKDGWPNKFIIRDLEGVSVDKEKVKDDVIPIGPLFYTKEEAWARTSYYFVVNHLGSLIHALAKDMKVNENYFWKIVRQILLQEYENTRNEYVLHLLSANSFLAKKNLISCLVGKSETPFYIPVSNILKKLESEKYENVKSYV